MIVVLVLLVLVVVVVVAVGAYRQRPEHTIESGISSFRREMRALAPPGRRPQSPGPDDGTAPPAQPPPGEHPVASPDEDDR